MAKAAVLGWYTKFYGTRKVNRMNRKTVLYWRRVLGGLTLRMWTDWRATGARFGFINRGNIDFNFSYSPSILLSSELCFVCCRIIKKLNLCNKSRSIDRVVFCDKGV